MQRFKQTVFRGAETAARDADRIAVKAAKAADHIAMLSMEVIGSLSAVPTYVILFAPVMATLLGVGVSLIVARAAFLWVTPELISMSGIIAFGMNWAVDSLDIFEVIVSDTIDIILDIIDVLTFSKPDHVVASSLTWSDISATQVKIFLSTVSSSCRPYDNIATIFDATAKLTSSSSICPIIRASQPMPVLSGITSTFLGWLSYDWDPNPGGNNCKEPLANDHVVLCSIFGTGYIVLELLLPMLLGAIVLVAMGPTLIRMISTILATALDCIQLALKFVLELFE